MAEIVTQVSYGFEEAKKAVYDIMKKYYPKIGDSKSTLVNALVSGLAWLYAMWQVFAKLTRAELYVSTARELESLYKLIPLVGVEIYPPIPMAVFSSLSPTDKSITADGQNILYVEPEGSLTDGNGYGFVSAIKKHIKEKVFDFSIAAPSDAAKHFRVIGAGGRILSVSLGQSLGEICVPVSIFIEDTVYVEFPYWHNTLAAVRFARLRVNTGSLSGVHLPFVDDGSDAIGDIFLSTSYLDVWTGELYLEIKNSINATFNNAALTGLPVNMSWTVRPSYLKSLSASDIPVATYDIYPFGAWPDAAYVYQEKTFGVVAGGQLKITGTTVGQMKSIHLTGGGGLRSRVDPYSVVLKNGDVTFDFSLAAEPDMSSDPNGRFADPVWGTIYRVKTYYGSTWYFAYILDEWGGLVFFENPKAVELGASPNDFTVSFTTVGSKGAFDQYDQKVKNVNPPSEFNFDRMAFILVTEDPVIFDELVIRITDSGYENLVFEQVRSVAAVSSVPEKTYYEVAVLSPTKLEIKFAPLDYAAISNLQISYKTVKQISSYKSGEQMTGPVKLKNPNGTYYTHSGIGTFQFQAINLFSGSGPSGIPSIEALRDTLAKAAYVYDRNVSAQNYEAAIQAYFLGTGKDARVKVFGYEDFGTMFLDSVNGNVVFFVGVLNSYVNSDPVLVVPTEADPSASYSRVQLAESLPWLLTDFGPYSNGVILPIGRNPTEIDQLQEALRDVSLVCAMVLSDGSASARSFVQQFRVNFQLKLRPALGCSYAEAVLAVKGVLVNKFRWSTFAFVRDLAVSDIYRELDELLQVDQVLLQNMSVHNNFTGSIKVMDIAYQTVYPGDTPDAERPLWDFRLWGPGRKIKIDILGLGGIDIEQY